MNRPRLLASLLASVSGRQFKPTVVLLVSTLTTIAWRYYGSPEFYLGHLSGRFALDNDPKLTAAVYTFVGALVLLGLIPAMVVKLVFRECLADYGVQLGDRVRTVRSFLLCAPAMVLIGYVTSSEPVFQAVYPLHRGLLPKDFALHAAMYFLFYLGWEFHFRGFLQYGLRDSMGAVNALLVQTLASTLLHIGKPDGETFGAILAGLVWGLLAYRTRSLLSGTLQHFLLAISLDWFICSDGVARP